VEEMCDARTNLLKLRTLIFKGNSYASNLKDIMKTNLIYETRGSKRERGIGKTNLERLDQALVEVPSKKEIIKSNLIESFFKSRLPVQLRRCPPFGATVLSQCTPIRAG
jgi:hypothetical protein